MVPILQKNVKLSVITYSDILFCIIGVHKVFRIKLLIILEPDHAFRIEDFMLLCPGKSPYFSDIVCKLVFIWSLFLGNVGPYQVPIGTILVYGLELETLHLLIPPPI